MIRMQIGSRPLPIDSKERELSSLIVEQEALRREETPTSNAEADKLEQKSPKLKKICSVAAAMGAGEKADRRTQRQKNNSNIYVSKKKSWNAKLIITKSPNSATTAFRKLKKKLKKCKKNLMQNPTGCCKKKSMKTSLPTSYPNGQGFLSVRCSKEKRKSFCNLKMNCKTRCRTGISHHSRQRSYPAFTLGLKRPQPSNGSLSIFRATGVGKTELAKALAEQLFSTKMRSFGLTCPNIWRSTASRK